MLDLDAVRSRLPDCWRPTWHDRVSSTNDLVAAAALLGAPAGTVIGADVQEAGRGRWGRRWSAEPDRSLLFSFLACPPPAAPSAWLGPITALATVRAARDLGADTVGFRWPNDVVCPAGKLAGILVETAAGGFVVGLGVNVFGPVWEVEPGITAATLESAGAAVSSREDLLVSLLTHLSALYELLTAGDTAALLAATSAADVLTGRRLLLAVQDTQVEGLYLGMDDRARLRLQTDSGRMTFPAGEVTRLVA